MAPIPVIVKHQGKKHELEMDPEATGETFKLQLYSLTGVEPERQKILAKGGQLKDETVLGSLGAKSGQTFIMMGTPSTDGNATELLRPKEKIRFVEDMSDAEAARVDGATPAGLQNLGNTCYMNSTLQTLRAVPELQDQLARYTPGNLSQFGLTSVDLAGSLRDLFRQMSETQEGFPPMMFLHALQTAYPQFAEKSKTGHGYAQQDAEEAWTQIIAQLRTKLTITEEAQDVPFVDRYLAGRFSSQLKLDEEGSEEPVDSEDPFLKLDCHIEATTNHLRDGILTALSEKLEKSSPSLGRDAVYTKTSRISRLPRYLTVHFVRFFWKREIKKKAKIMRKVTFPAELDVTEFCTDLLRKRIVPVRDKIRSIRKDEEDMTRARKRQKMHATEEEPKTKDSKDKKEPEKVEESAKYKTDAEYEAERATTLLQAKRELMALVDPDLAADKGCNATGLYELRGIVTHQGASADSGHYTSYVKKQGPMGPDGKRLPEDGKWWWFNDEKVSEVEADKIETLSGGGESHSALILLYRAVDLPTPAEIDSNDIHHRI